MMGGEEEECVVSQFKLGETNLLRHFVLLGVSKYSNTDLIVSIMDKLLEMMTKEPEKVDDIIKEIIDISEKMQNSNMDAMFLTLAMCYLKSSEGKEMINDDINKLCRIPTHLFNFIDVLKNLYECKGKYDKKFYEYFLKKKGSYKGKKRSVQGTKAGDKKNVDKNQVPKQTMESAEENRGGKGKADKGLKDVKFSTFVGKLKFVKNWYCDPNKTSEDLLLLLTKYSHRSGMDHKKIIGNSHIKLEGEGSEIKNCVITYILKGFEGDVENMCNECEEKALNKSDLVCQPSSRLCKFVKALQQVKTVTSDKSASLANIIDLIKECRRASTESRFAVPVGSSEDYMAIPECSNVFGCPMSEETEYDEEEFVTEPGEKQLEPTIEDKKETLKRKLHLTRIHLVLEHISNHFYNVKMVWAELIIDIPLAALLRNVVHLSSLKLFEGTEGENNIDIFKEKFLNPTRNFPPSIHPFQVLKALIGYQAHVHKMKRTRDINPRLMDVLQKTYYAACKRNRESLKFDNCVVLIDCSKSMSMEGFLGSHQFNAIQASLAILTAMEEGNSGLITTFMCTQQPRPLTKKDLLERLKNKIKNTSNTSEEIDSNDMPVPSEVVEELSKLKISPITKKNEKKSNLAIVLQKYLSIKHKVKAFVIFTKSRKDSICGGDPYGVFKKYVEEVNRDAKLIICSMEAKINTIADPRNGNVNILCGGDADLLPSMHDFIYN